MRGRLLAALLPLYLFADAHIFVYHRFGDSRHPSTDTSIETLRAEFEYLKAHDYKVIPLSQLAGALKEKRKIDDKWVVLTIDDNYKSFYQNALPLFKAYNYPFTLFVYAEAADKRYGDFMNWRQIEEASRYGEIGLHGYGHRHECRLSPAILENDTRQALHSFQTHLRRRPQYYAYPYGEYDPEVKRTIASFGFRLILNQNSGAVNAKSDPLDLDRIALTGENLIAQKLKIQRLDTEWITPKHWPNGGRLKEIHAKIAAKYTSAQYYISGGGWHRVRVRNGEVLEKLDVQLPGPRCRVFLRVGRRQNGIILVKE